MIAKYEWMNLADVQRLEPWALVKNLEPKVVSWQVMHSHISKARKHHLFPMPQTALDTKRPWIDVTHSKDL
jgi:hypothetical protein